jgi:hypothetical protein
MSTLELFHSIQSSHLSAVLGEQDHLFGAVAEVFHIAGLILVLSSILLVCLRLLGLGLTAHTAPQLFRATSNFFWIGLAFLVVSGLFLFIPAADQYYPNAIFWYKFAFLAAALLVHLTLYRWIAKRPSTQPVVAKFTGILALGLWLSVAFSGRFIGFF